MIQENFTAFHKIIQDKKEKKIQSQQNSNTFLKNQGYSQ